jgi:hypothetical protein
MLIKYFKKYGKASFCPSDEEIKEGEHIKKQVKLSKDSQQILENILSLRNALMLYKTLKNEKIREVAICLDGMDQFVRNYPYFCKFRTAFLYPRK